MSPKPLGDYGDDYRFSSWSSLYNRGDKGSVKLSAASIPLSGDIGSGSLDLQVVVDFDLEESAAVMRGSADFGQYGSFTNIVMTDDGNPSSYDVGEINFYNFRYGDEAVKMTGYTDGEEYKAVYFNFDLELFKHLSSAADTQADFVAIGDGIRMSLYQDERLENSLRLGTISGDRSIFTPVTGD